MNPLIRIVALYSPGCEPIYIYTEDHDDLGETWGKCPEENGEHVRVFYGRRFEWPTVVCHHTTPQKQKRNSTT